MPNSIVKLNDKMSYDFDSTFNSSQIIYWPRSAWRAGGPTGALLLAPAQGTGGVVIGRRRISSSDRAKLKALR